MTDEPTSGKTDWAAQQVSPEQGVKLRRLDPIWYTKSSGSCFEDRIDPIDLTWGVKPFSYGAALAYLQRRFGLSEIGSDPYKEIAAWLITTPDPEVFLRISPLPHEEARLSMAVYVSENVRRENDLWESHYSKAWRQTFLDVIQRPDSSDCDLVRRSRTIMNLHPEGMICEEGLYLLSRMRFDQGSVNPDADIARRAKAIIDDFERDNPYPGIRVRPADPEQLEADDPLRRILPAISALMLDLRRGVSVRDQAIDITGIREDDAVDFGAHPISGFPVGKLVNEDPHGTFKDVFALREERKSASAEQDIDRDMDDGPGFP